MKLLTTFFLFIASTLLFSQENEEYQFRLKKVDDCLDNDYYDCAINESEKFVTAFPSDSMAYYKRAVSYYYNEINEGVRSKMPDIQKTINKIEPALDHVKSDKSKAKIKYILAMIEYKKLYYDVNKRTLSKSTQKETANKILEYLEFAQNNGFENDEQADEVKEKLTTLLLELKYD